MRAGSMGSWGAHPIGCPVGGGTDPIGVKVILCGFDIGRALLILLRGLRRLSGLLSPNCNGSLNMSIYSSNNKKGVA